MFSLFLVFSQSLRPVILVPGTFSSTLRVTGSNLAKDWFCPRKLDHLDVWANRSYFTDPIHNCVLQWFKVYYDSSSSSAISHPNGTIETVDFGGLGGFYTDAQLQQFLPYFTYMINYFKKNGYEEKKNLFGAPYDWRFGLSSFTQKTKGANNKNDINDYYKSLKSLVEDNFGAEKFVFVAQGFGASVVHNFLNSYVDGSWASKYIEKIIYITPNIAGSVLVDAAAYTGLDLLNIFGETTSVSSYMFETVNSLGSVHCQLTNYELFADESVFTDPDGKSYNAKDFVEQVLLKRKYNEDTKKLFELNKAFVEKVLPSKNAVKTAVIYNSMRETPVSFKLNSWDEGIKPEFVNGKGDGVIAESSVKKVCEKLSAESCQDLKLNSPFGDHWMLLFEQKLIDLVYQTVGNDNK